MLDGRWVGGVALGLSLAACGDADDAVPCEPAVSRVLDLAMNPPASPEGVPGTYELQATCRVSSDDPLALPLRLACDVAGATIEVGLDAPGFVGALPDAFASGATVHVDYATRRDVARDHGWLAIRGGIDESPILVALASSQPAPWFSTQPELAAPLALELVHDTDCAERMGSCNNGPARRGAVRLEQGDESITVLDRNVADIGPYRMQVGEATVDEGECGGLSETWFETLIVRP